MISKKYSQPFFMIFMSFGTSIIIGAVVMAFTMAPIVRPLVNKIASKN
jgi:hypothetical protein